MQLDKNQHIFKLFIFILKLDNNYITMLNLDQIYLILINNF